MKKLLIKEMRLTASPLSYIFLAAVLFTLVPGYPILMGAFFICMGIFQSFQNGREANDILYTALLPVRKSDVVRAKYAFTCMIQLIGFAATAGLTVLRMTVLSRVDPYVTNALMNPSPVFLAFELLIFAAFNLLFLGGYFRTAYGIGIPFLSFGIATFVIVGIAEALHHLPGLSFLNTTSGERLGLQLIVLALAAAVYAAVTFLSCRTSVGRFEKSDL